MSQPTHLDEAIDRDTETLRRRVRKVADLAIKAVEDSILSLKNRDRKLAYSVILNDNRIDVLEGHIDRLCQEFLVRHIPVASQLRFVLSVIKINAELELELPEGEDYDTIAGFVFATLGRIPAAGEEFRHDNVRFRIVAAEPRKIKRLRLHVQREKAEST